MTLPIAGMPPDPVGVSRAHTHDSEGVLSFAELLDALFQRNFEEDVSGEGDRDGETGVTTEKPAKPPSGLDSVDAAPSTGQQPEPTVVSDLGPPEESPPSADGDPEIPEATSPAPQVWLPTPQSPLGDGASATQPGNGPTVAIEAVASNPIASEAGMAAMGPAEPTPPPSRPHSTQISNPTSQTKVGVEGSLPTLDEAVVDDGAMEDLVQPTRPETLSATPERSWQHAGGAAGQMFESGVVAKPGGGHQLLSSQTVERITQWLEQAELGRGDATMSVELTDPDGDFLVRLAMRHGRLELMVTRGGSEVPFHLLEDLDDALTRHGFDVVSDEEREGEPEGRRRRSRQGDPSFDNELEARREE